jgi:D-3-phosphoglycerate dehydrogenase
MRIAIPDDYQDIVHRLKCFDLLRGHEVVRFREPARSEDELVERLREAERMKRGERPATLAHRLSGSTLGVFGLGTIGSLVAAAGAGLGMRVLVFGREKSFQTARQAGYEVARHKAQLFEASDVLTLQVRLTPETRGSVTREDLGRMKPSALFVNTARAELVQPGALLESLRNGRPGYAALDVYEEEPVPPDHPLLAMSNVLCTPHLGWAEYDNFELYFGECFREIAAWSKGR